MAALYAPILCVLSQASEIGYNLRMNNTSHCLCGDPRGYEKCCGPIHTDISNAESAESLMRARYSAYSIDKLDFIRQSWHSTTLPKDVGPNEDGFSWQGLKIIETQQGGRDDEQGEVEFIASYVLNGHAGNLHERSQFKSEDGQWRYLDGKEKKGAPVKSNKTGRNEPCPCGSGKKYKRCCA